MRKTFRSRRWVAALLTLALVMSLAPMALAADPQITVSPSTVELEQGQNGGSIDSLIMVEDYYHISIDYLVYGEDRDYISSLSEGLTDSQKRIVRATTENLIRNIKRYQHQR